MNLEDAVLARASQLFGDVKTGDLINRALRELVQRESARRLADLGGSDPEAWAPERRTGSFVVAEEMPPYNAQKKS